MQSKLPAKIRNSIFPNWANQPAGKINNKSILSSLILHLHPARLPENVLRFTHTFGLGGMAALLFVIQVSSGMLLRFVYEPFPGKAYESIVALQNEMLFGQLVRNIHHWSGILLIIVLLLHLLRVYFTGAFHNKRQFTWIIGLGLFITIILANFTGYLLPWDQLSYWAITVSTNMLLYIPLIGEWLQQIIVGGVEVGSSTLLFFYTMHTGFIPLFIVILMVFHFWRIRKAGGVVIPEDDDKLKYVATIPNLVVRELVVALVLIAGILLLSTFFNAPLQAKANPDLSPNPSKAPWYFMGLQELLLHFHPLFAVLIIPAIILIALFLLPYLQYDSDKKGRWFFSDKGQKMGVITAIFAFVLTLCFVIADEYMAGISTWLSDFPTSITDGLLPLSVIGAFLTGFYFFVKKKYAALNNESIQTLFIFLLVSFLALSFIGIWFRGAGMELVIFP